MLADFNSAFSLHEKLNFYSQLKEEPFSLPLSVVDYVAGLCI